MSKRSKECYSAVFDYIEDNIFKLEPDEFITDFECGMRSAINKCYPNAVLRGCWFHYCQSIRKNMLRFGLYSLLKTNYRARFIKKAIMSLPLLPADKFQEGLAYLAIL